MNTNRRTNQGGSVATFLIVAALLSAVVIAGAFAIQKRGAHVRTNEPIAQQATDTTPQKTDEQSKAQQSGSDKQKAEADEAAKQAEAKKAQEQKAAADKKIQEQKQADAAKQAAAAEAEKKRQQEQQAVIPQTSTAPTAKSLPQTGPSDALPEFVGAAILLGVLIAYLKSYRHRFGSLLG